MADAYREGRQALIIAVTASPGSLSPTVRAAIVERARGVTDVGSIPEALVGFVDKVARDATVIDDGTVAA